MADGLPAGRRALLARQGSLGRRQGFLGQRQCFLSGADGSSFTHLREIVEIDTASSGKDVSDAPVEGEGTWLCGTSFGACVQDAVPCTMRSASKNRDTIAARINVDTERIAGAQKYCTQPPVLVDGKPYTLAQVTAVYQVPTTPAVAAAPVAKS